MKAQWYYVENDETKGPTTLEDLARHIRQTGRSRLVWTEGMADWKDAGTVPALSRLLRTAPRNSAVAPERSGTEADSESKTAAIGQRVEHELLEYVMISTYLFVCFGAMLFYKAAILHSDGIEFAPFGMAAAKALILGKFVLVLHALKIGERKGGPGVLLADILKKSVLFFLVLSALSVAEEMIVGYFHGRPIREAIGEFGGGTLQQALATSVLSLLILIPYFTYRVVAARLGEGVLWKILTERQSTAAPSA